MAAAVSCSDTGAPFCPMIKEPLIPKEKSPYFSLSGMFRKSAFHLVRQIPAFAARSLLCHHTFGQGSVGKGLLFSKDGPSPIFLFSNPDQLISR